MTRAGEIVTSTATSPHGIGTDGGFSLIEVLVALAVFSIAGLALLSATHGTVASAARLDARLGANIVADNGLIEALTATDPLEAGIAMGTVDLGGRRYDWVRTTRLLDGYGVLAIDISVSEAGGEQVIASASGLREAAR